ncbi:MAG: tRNA uridine(34) 5-carboxymethylaminomethyl modification radical SAM/GNAT enzyme Elp3 [Candidatus ainarchaeum sp.]|nr:tRNA uridine(34) 5-carboxymethylaminomethyl modification radical SAM/GNAT enzyme Elp3 [Candidatus ainarchaeum sp.]
MNKDNEINFAKSIIKEINSNEINTEHELSLRQFFYAKKYNLTEVPARPFILAQIKKPNIKEKKLLSIKPTRSLSGVQTIAIMLPPFDCPGKCTYCPSQFKDKTAPKSYTGFEPSTLRAQRLNYDSFEIVKNRINQLDATGNNANKIELIFQGSSFTALDYDKQEEIVKKSIDACNEKIAKNFELSKKNAELSKRRVVGITFETRPDICNEKDIERMLYLGGTRVELGVQNISDSIYKKINRGHKVKDVIDATKKLKDSSFKVLYHLMPGLPGSNFKSDLKNFRAVFNNPNFSPDMVKFYPCLVIKGSKLYTQWKKKEFEPINEDYAIKLLSKIKSEIPPYVRIMRVNRDIPSNVISAGIKKTNLRQLIEKQMIKDGTKCNCIRCREIGLSKRELNENKKIANLKDTKPKLKILKYDASDGEEYFISFENKKNLFGFTRLRIPSNPFLKEITNRTALIRELHVYGKGISVGSEKEEASEQHKGYGQLLINEAEKIAKEKYDMKKMIIISGIGVREYYKKKFNYKDDNYFVSKELK